jgi:hypothetical protein
MSVPRVTATATNGLERLQVELPDLAYDLERQGRLDAADVVMMLHARVRELAAGPDRPGVRPDNMPEFFIPPRS